MFVIRLLQEQPALAVFLVIGFGYIFGRLRIAGVQVGTSTGVLLGGLALGNFGVQGTSASQSIGFMLFIYCVGLRAGPQFFSAFRANGARFLLLSIAVAALGSVTAAALSAWLGFPVGFQAGLLAGALTSTPTLVAAQDAVRAGIAELPPGVSSEVVLGNLAASYAITYIVGTFGLLLVISVLPRVMGIDLKEEAHRLAGEVSPQAFDDNIVPAALVRNLDAVAQRLGGGKRGADETDLVTFALGIAAGLAIGMISVTVGGIPIGLGTAGGLMLSGLVIGFVRTLSPKFGQIPVAAASVLMELGLQFFMVNVGLSAGATFLSALWETGPWLPLAAVIVMTVPVVVGFAVGSRLLGFDAIVLLGALTGAMTSTPALDMVNRQADSTLPTVGYAGTYAFANVLLASAGSILMRF